MFKIPTYNSFAELALANGCFNAYGLGQNRTVVLTANIALNTENIKIVDCFSQDGECVVVHDEKCGCEVYMVDDAGMVIEKLQQRFATPEEFDAQKHKFIASTHG